MHAPPDLFRLDIASGRGPLAERRTGRHSVAPERDRRAGDRVGWRPDVCRRGARRRQLLRAERFPPALRPRRRDRRDCVVRCGGPTAWRRRSRVSGIDRLVTLTEGRGTPVAPLSALARRIAGALVQPDAVAERRGAPHRGDHRMARVRGRQADRRRNVVQEPDAARCAAAHHRAPASRRCSPPPAPAPHRRNRETRWLRPRGRRGGRRCAR